MWTVYTIADSCGMPQIVAFFALGCAVPGVGLCCTEAHAFFLAVRDGDFEKTGFLVSEGQLEKTDFFILDDIGECSGE